jgi:hypothetical protein
MPHSFVTDRVEMAASVLKTVVLIPFSAASRNAAASSKERFVLEEQLVALICLSAFRFC